MIIGLLTIVHTFVSVFLILVVLLQTGRGADVAAAFGGASQTAFGARGASTLLSKMTTISAVVFMFTSLTLALLSSGGGGSVVDAAPATPSAPISAPASGTPPAGAAPAAPASPAPAAPEPATPPGSGSQPPQPGSPAPNEGGF